MQPDDRSRSPKSVAGDPPQRVLVCDRRPEVVEAVRADLDPQRFVIRSVGDPALAVAHLDSFSPTVFLWDGARGLGAEAFSALRAKLAARGQAFVGVVDVRAGSMNVERLLAAGPSAVIYLPTAPGMIGAAIERVAGEALRAGGERRSRLSSPRGLDALFAESAEWPTTTFEYRVPETSGSSPVGGPA